MTTPAVLGAFLVLLAAFSLVQGWRHAGQRSRHRRARPGRTSPRPARRPTPVGHDQWVQPGPYRKPRTRAGCDVYIYWPWNAYGDGPDRTGRPAYVGKALDWRERVRDHDDKPWWPKVYPVPDVQRVSTERAALDREWYLIGELDAVHNERRPTGWQPTGRPSFEVLRGFRPAPDGLAHRSTRRPARTGRAAHSIRSRRTTRATWIGSTAGLPRSWSSRSWHP
jgi:hypothetical protein